MADAGNATAPGPPWNLLHLMPKRKAGNSLHPSASHSACRRILHLTRCLSFTQITPTVPPPVSETPVYTYAAMGWLSIWSRRGFGGDIRSLVARVCGLGIATPAMLSGAPSPSRSRLIPVLPSGRCRRTRSSAGAPCRKAHLHQEAGMDGGVAAGPLAAAPACRRSFPAHPGVEPDRRAEPRRLRASLYQAAMTVGMTGSVRQSPSNGKHSQKQCPGRHDLHIDHCT